MNEESDKIIFHPSGLVEILMLDCKTSMMYIHPMMGNRLKNILKREKVTAYRLCKDLKIDQAQLSRFLHEHGGISLEKLEQIADYLGYDITFVKHKPSQKGR